MKPRALVEAHGARLGTLAVSDLEGGVCVLAKPTGATPLEVLHEARMVRASVLSIKSIACM